MAQPGELQLQSYSCLLFDHRLTQGTEDLDLVLFSSKLDAKSWEMG